MGGGVPSFMPLLHIASASPFILSSIKSAQKRAKVNNFLVCFGVSSGFSETKNGESKRLFYFRGFRGAAFIPFCGGGSGVHWEGFEASGPAGGWLWSSRGVFRPFLPAFCLFVALPFVLLSRISLEICPISHFKGVFCAVWGCCVGLCWLGALRGLWGFLGA